MPVSGRTTSFRILHPLNAFSEISVNPSGIITFSIPVKYEISYELPFMLSGKVTSFSSP